MDAQDILEETLRKTKSEKKSKISKLRENPWILATCILAGVVLVLLILNFFGMTGSITGMAVSGEEAGQNLIDFLNTRTDSEIKYVSHEDLGNMYQINVLYKDNIVPVFVTKDGQYYSTGSS